MKKSFGQKIESYIESNFYVWGNNRVTKDYYRCVIEEAKCKYAIVVNTDGVWVDADIGSGATKKRAKEIKRELERVKEKCH